MSLAAKILITFLACLGVCAPTLAQPQVSPAKRQSPEQLKQDEARCEKWAQQQSGFDPARPEFASRASASLPAAGSSVRTRREATAGTGRAAGDAAAAGAVRAASTKPTASAAAAAIVGRDAGNAAPGGAVAGSIVQRDDTRKALTVVEESHSPQRTAEASFLKARTECLEGSGYTVRERLSAR